MSSAPPSHKPEHRRIVTGPNMMTKEEREKLREKFQREKAESDARARALAEEATKGMKLDEDKPL